MLIKSGESGDNLLGDASLLDEAGTADFADGCDQLAEIDESRPWFSCVLNYDVGGRH